MRFAIPFLAGLAAASPFGKLAPRLDGVRIISMSAIGSGCPAGHAVAVLDATGTVFDIAFDQYTVSTGPGTELSDARKNCRVTMNVEFPAGWQFSIIETRFTGYASIPQGLTGTCRAAYTFSGEIDELVFRQDIPGGYSDNYVMVAGAGVESWSRCGGTTAIFNINSEVRITPADTRLRGLMTVSSAYLSAGLPPATAAAAPQCRAESSDDRVCFKMDSIDGRVHLLARANWRRC